MNKSQAEKKVNAFQAVFRVDVNDVKPFQNPILTSTFDHFLNPQSMPRLFKTINRWLIQTAFIDPISAVDYGGQAGYAHTKMII